jgi:3-methylcrotonyl-CoA carboxylase alpha subunit
MSMQVRLALGGRLVTVALERTDDGFAATLDGRAHRITLFPRRTAATAVEELSLEVDGRPCAAVVARTRDRIVVGLDGRTFSFATADAEARAGDARARSGAAVAPMPGKVIAVLVAVGDTVEAGQPLVVLEAMKMETTLAAEVGGQVSAVLAVPGATVDAGAVLVEIGAPG